MHWSFDDPSAAIGSDEQRLQAFRAVREGIQQRLRMFQSIAAKQ
jgi:arsenate reductase